jgi:hypothetical protein
LLYPVRLCCAFIRWQRLAELGAACVALRRIALIWLDSTYIPAFPVASRYAHYFRPTMLTNDSGSLSEQVADDLLIFHEKGNANPLSVTIVKEKQVTAPVSPPAY